MPYSTLHRPSGLTVIVPNYNHGRFLPFALDAILSQSLQPREIWVIDDASTDNSRTVIADYAARFSHIRPIYIGENQGVVRNMNHALANARDDLLFFAAADDIIMPGLFEQSVALMRAYPQAGLCSALSRLMDLNGKDLGPFPTPRPRQTPGYITPREAATLLLREDSWMIGNTSVFRRVALIQSGGFHEELAGFTDGYVSRVLALRFGACFIPEELAYWRRNNNGVAGQTTSNITKAIAVADIACRLMTQENPGLFPERYPSLWRGRWLFGAIMRPSQVKSKTLNLRRAMTDPLVIDRIVLPILDAAGNSQLIKIYGFLRLRPQDVIPVIKRRFRSFYMRLWR